LPCLRDRVQAVLSETQAVCSTHLPHTLRTYNALKIRFSATLGEEPEIEVGFI